MQKNKQERKPCWYVYHWPELVLAVDTWMSKHKFKNRSDAVLRLIQAGLSLEFNMAKMQETIQGLEGELEKFKKANNNAPVFSLAEVKEMVKKELKTQLDSIKQQSVMDEIWNKLTL